MIQRYPTTTAFLALLLLLGSSAAGAQFGLFDDKPAIGTVSTAELRAKLAARADGDGVVLVDVRTPEEIAVSVIPGAISASDFEAERERFRDAEIIAYCTVGVRSEHYARRLVADGYRASNYKASILGWVDEGLPVVTPAGEPTRQVHVYSDDYSVPAPYEAVTEGPADADPR
jgi:rhodanese-related sulfurtransferase